MLPLFLNVSDRLSLVVEALNPDGVKRWRRQGLAPANSEDKVRALGLQLGQAVRDDAGDELITA